MLRVKKFEKTEDKCVLQYEFDNTRDEVVLSEEYQFDNKNEALKHYAGCCWHYTVQCFDKMRIIGTAYYIKLPEWTEALYDLDYPKLAERVLENAKHLKFTHELKEVNEALQKKVNNAISAVEELKKICIKIKKF